MKKLFVFAVILGLFAMIFISPWNMEVRANDTMKVNERKYFTSYVVQKDDTLWDIADKYMTPEYDSIDHYIREVMESNHMEHSGIKQGQLLVLPYYADSPVSEL